MRDPYDILGIARNASAATIKKAYRALAPERHPDRRPGHSGAESAFKELAAAYTLLSDNTKREAFDHGVIDADGQPRRPRQGPRQHPGQHPGQQQERRRAGIKFRGKDVFYALHIGFLEAINGTTKRINMTNGKRLEVRVPLATDNGQILRLKGQGLQGFGGGGDGDALVEILVAPHGTFRRDGLNIHIEAPTSLPVAVLGGKIEVPTIDGTVSLSVPENSNTGTVLRLQGKGIKIPGKARGDQHVALKVVLPNKPDAKLTAFVRQWSEKKKPTKKAQPAKAK